MTCSPWSNPRRSRPWHRSSYWLDEHSGPWCRRGQSVDDQPLRSPRADSASLPAVWSGLHVSTPCCASQDHSSSTKTPSIFSLKSLEAMHSNLPDWLLCPNFTPLPLMSRRRSQLHARHLAWRWSSRPRTSGHCSDRSAPQSCWHTSRRWCWQCARKTGACTLHKKGLACKLLQAMPSFRSRRAIDHAASHSRASLAAYSPQASDASSSLDPSNSGMWCALLSHPSAPHGRSRWTCWQRPCQSCTWPEWRPSSSRILLQSIAGRPHGQWPIQPSSHLDGEERRALVRRATAQSLRSRFLNHHLGASLVP